MVVIRAMTTSMVKRVEEKNVGLVGDIQDDQFDQATE